MTLLIWRNSNYLFLIFGCYSFSLTEVFDESRNTAQPGQRRKESSRNTKLPSRFCGLQGEIVRCFGEAEEADARASEDVDVTREIATSRTFGGMKCLGDVFT